MKLHVVTHSCMNHFIIGAGTFFISCKKKIPIKKLTEIIVKIKRLKQYLSSKIKVLNVKEGRTIKLGEHVICMFWMKGDTQTRKASVASIKRMLLITVSRN